MGYSLGGVDARLFDDVVGVLVWPLIEPAATVAEVSVHPVPVFNPFLLPLSSAIVDLGVPRPPLSTHAPAPIPSQAGPAV